MSIFPAEDFPTEFLYEELSPMALSPFDAAAKLNSPFANTHIGQPFPVNTPVTQQQLAQEPSSQSSSFKSQSQFHAQQHALMSEHSPMLSQPQMHSNTAQKNNNNHQLNTQHQMQQNLEHQIQNHLLQEQLNKQLQDQMKNQMQEQMHKQMDEQLKKQQLNLQQQQFHQQAQSNHNTLPIQANNQHNQVHQMQQIQHQQHSGQQNQQNQSPLLQQIHTQQSNQQQSNQQHPFQSQANNHTLPSLSQQSPLPFQQHNTTTYPAGINIPSSYPVSYTPTGFDDNMAFSYASAPDTDKRRKRRESHNAVERRRRDTINEKIAELSLLLPDLVQEIDSGQKPQKGIILRRTVDYIQHAQDLMIRANVRIGELESVVRGFMAETGRVESELGLVCPLGTIIANTDILVPNRFRTKTEETTENSL